MRLKCIWVMIGMMLLWMLWMGISLIVDFERVIQSNRASAELEWTFLCDASGDYADISVIEGGSNFIGELSNEIEYAVIDETGSKRSDTYDSLKPLGNGYVRYEVTPPGIVIMEDGVNQRMRIGVLNEEGQELPEEESLRILEKGTGDSGENEVSDSEENSPSGEVSYTVKQGGSGRYEGLMDNTGKWVIPPAFGKVEVTADQKYAVLRNSDIIGIVKLGERHEQ